MGWSAGGRAQARRALEHGVAGRIGLLPRAHGRQAMNQASGIFGIEAASRYLPQQLPIQAWAQANHADAATLATLEKQGMRNFHHAGDESVEDMAGNALQALIDSHGLDREDVDLLVFVHSLSTSTPAAPASLPARLASAFGLGRARCFALSGQNCASLLLSLRVMRSLFHAEPDLKKVLLVSADRCCGESYRTAGGITFHSDGASALLLGRDTPFNRVLALEGHVSGRHHRAYARPEALRREYRTLYGTIAHRLLTRTAQFAGLALGDFRYLVAENLDLNISRRLATSLGQPADWVYSDNVSACGHVQCSDSVIDLVDLWHSGPINPDGDNLLFFMSGANGSQAAMALGRCRAPGSGPSS
ncbi:hypothetical protein L0936_05535 [Paracidovorax citrulli]|nr:hypothetical protein [Paracidovorax citrulli]